MAIPPIPYILFTALIGVGISWTMGVAASRVARRHGIGLWAAILRDDYWGEEVILGLRARRILDIWTLVLIVGFLLLVLIVNR